MARVRFLLTDLFETVSRVLPEAILEILQLDHSFKSSSRHTLQSAHSKCSKPWYNNKLKVDYYYIVSPQCGTSITAVSSDVNDGGTSSSDVGSPPSTILNELGIFVKSGLITALGQDPILRGREGV